MPPASEDAPNRDDSAGDFTGPSIEELNEALPDLEIVEAIGQGGMGAVYKARQPRLNRFVAVKLLPPITGTDDYNFAERFEQEAQAMAQLSHPNIVTVHDFGETEHGYRYIVMEYVDGSDLHQLIQSGQLTLKHTMGWIPQICSALQCAHERGLVHRDIKPANILINREGVAKVVDFGLAKLVGNQADSQLTQADFALGTPDYAPPEVTIEGAMIDHRADIFSFGVLFYEMLTQQVPRGTWKPPSEIAGVDVRLDDIIAKSMQPNPEDRYRSIAEISEILDEIRRTPKMVVAGGGGKKLMTAPVSPVKKAAAGGTGPVRPARMPKRRSGMSPAALAGIVVGIAAIAGGLIWLLTHGPDDVEKEPGPELVAVTPPEQIPQPIPNPPEPRPAPPSIEVEPEPAPPDLPESMPAPGPQPPDPPEPEPPPQIPATFSGEWLALLPDLDVEAAAFAGNWRMEGGHLVSESRQRARTKNPRLELTRELGPAYEIEMVFRREESDGNVILMLPVEGERYAPLYLSGYNGSVAGINGLEGKGVSSAENPSRRPLNLENGREHRVHVRVRRGGGEASIAASLDGNVLFDWSGPIEAIPEGDTFGWTPRSREYAAIGTVNRTTILDLRMRSGNAAGVPGEWTDALAGIDVESETVSGVWILDSGGVTLDPESANNFARIQLPAEIPDDFNYDIEMVVRRNQSEESLTVIAPFPEQHYAVVALASYLRYAGLTGLNGRGLSEDSPNPTKREFPIETGRDYRLFIQCRTEDRTARVAVAVDGEPLFDWEGELASLARDGNWALIDRTKMGLGAYAPSTYSSIRVRPAGNGPALPPGDWIDLLPTADLSSGVVEGDWGIDNGALKLRNSRGNHRFQFPAGVPADFNYDVEAVMRADGGVDGLVVTVPVSEDRFAAMMLGGWVGVNAGIALVDDLDLSHESENPTKREFRIEQGRDYKVFIQVRRRGDTARVTMAAEGETLVDWTGELSRLLGQDSEIDSWIPSENGRIAVGSYTEATFSRLRMRAAVFGPAQVAERIAAIAAEHDPDAAGGPAFEAGLASLNQSYRGALRKLLGNNDPAVQTAAQAELNRLDETRPLEAEDPAGFPGPVKNARNIYRREWNKLALRRAHAGLPALNNQRQALEALREEIVKISVDPGAVDAKIANLESRIDRIETGAGTAGISEPVARGLERPRPPLKRPEKRGGAVVWARVPGSVDLARMKPPGGLSTTVVDLAGQANLVAALKYNGEVVMWGTYPGYRREDEIAAMKGIVRVAMADEEHSWHVAGIGEDGRIQCVVDNWNDNATTRLEARNLANPVQLSLRGRSAYALLEDGTIKSWADHETLGLPTGLNRVARIAHGPWMRAMILEDLSLKVMRTPDAPNSTPEFPARARDILFGTQDTVGAVAQLPSGKWRAIGDFEKHQAALETAIGDQRVDKVIAGFGAFAVLTRDRRWSFFGEAIDAAHCRREADGCVDLVILREYVIGLKPK